MCFSLQLDGMILDNFTELKNIENLKEGSLLKVIEGELISSVKKNGNSQSSCLFSSSSEQYTVREVRIHVRHINELIHSCDPIDLYSGNNGYSLCLVNDITNGDISSNNGKDKCQWSFRPFQKKDLFDLERRKGVESNGVDFSVPEYLLPNQKDIFLTPLFAMNNKNRVCSKTDSLDLITGHYSFSAFTMSQGVVLQWLESTEWFTKITRFDWD